MVCAGKYYFNQIRSDFTLLSGFSLAFNYVIFAHLVYFTPFHIMLASLAPVPGPQPSNGV